MPTNMARLVWVAPFLLAETAEKSRLCLLMVGRVYHDSERSVFDFY